MNGRMWNNATANEKTVYVYAFRDGVFYERTFGEQKSAEESETLANNYTGGEYVKELDGFYSATENIRVPLPMEINHLTMKLSGTHSKAEVGKRLQTLQALTAKWSEPQK